MYSFIHLSDGEFLSEIHYTLSTFSDSQLQTAVRASSYHFEFLKGLRGGWLWEPCKERALGLE